MFSLMTDKLRVLVEKFNDTYKVNLNIFIALAIVSQHSFVIKFFGIFLLALLNLNWIRRIELKKIPLFYSLIPALEILKFAFMNESYSVPHLSQFIVGMIYWIASLY